MENQTYVDQKRETADRPAEPRTCFLGPAPLKEAVRQSRLEKRNSVDQKLDNNVSRGTFHRKPQPSGSESGGRRHECPLGTPKMENRASVDQKEDTKPEKRKSVTQNRRSKLENGDSVDQKPNKVDRLFDEKASLLRKQGTVVASWRKYKGKRLGPYYRLVYREDGRQRSVYIGADHNRAEHIHQKLKDLQQPLRQRRQLQKMKKVIRRELARSQAEWNRELMKLGLYLKGSEVRGWRNCSSQWQAYFSSLERTAPSDTPGTEQDASSYPFFPVEPLISENPTSVDQKPDAQIGKWQFR